VIAGAAVVCVLLWFLSGTWLGWFLNAAFWCLAAISFGALLVEGVAGFRVFSEVSRANWDHLPLQETVQLRTEWMNRWRRVCDESGNIFVLGGAIIQALGALLMGLSLTLSLPWTSYGCALLMTSFLQLARARQLPYAVLLSASDRAGTLLQLVRSAASPRRVVDLLRFDTRRISSIARSGDNLRAWTATGDEWETRARAILRMAPIIVMDAGAQSMHVERERAWIREDRLAFKTIVVHEDQPTAVECEGALHVSVRELRPLLVDMRRARFMPTEARPLSGLEAPTPA